MRGRRGGLRNAGKSAAALRESGRIGSIAEQYRVASDDEVRDWIAMTDEERFAVNAQFDGREKRFGRRQLPTNPRKL